MHINYPETISESEVELHALERRLRGQRTHDQVRLLWLLKSGTASTLKDCVPLLGYSMSHLKRWWARYTHEGLPALMAEPRQGRKPLITPMALAGLQTAMAAGDIGTLNEGRRYLAEQWGVHYRSVYGVWWHTRRPQQPRRLSRLLPDTASLAAPQNRELVRY